MGVEDQNIALAGAMAFLMSRASTFLMGEKKGGEKQPMSRASTFFMGEKKTQNSFPEFLVQTLKKSKTKKSKNSIIVHQICCHAFLEEQSWCSMNSSSFLFYHHYY